jgi:hypothetical protein
MTRLPTPGGDDGKWGGILNEFLGVVHNSDGSLKNVVRPGDIAGFYTKPGGGIPESDLASALQSKIDAAITSTPAYVIDSLVISGAAAVGTDVVPPGSRVAQAVTITQAHILAGTAPNGSSLTVTVSRFGTVLFTLTLADGQTSADQTGLSVALSAGDVLTYNITAIGSVGPGSDIAVQLIGS